MQKNVQKMITLRIYSEHGIFQAVNNFQKRAMIRVDHGSLRGEPKRLGKNRPDTFEVPDVRVLQDENHIIMHEWMLDSIGIRRKPGKKEYQKNLKRAGSLREYSV